MNGFGVNFGLKTPSDKHHLDTGQFDIKFMVQSWQVNADHADSRYCAAIFKYLREFAIMFRSHVSFASQDDKHFVKVGEPGFPVAAV